jgi:hypothetical protein
MSIFPTFQLSGSSLRFFLLKVVDKVGGCGLAQFVKFFKSVLASFSRVSLKTPATSLQWKRRLGQMLLICSRILTVDLDKRSLLCPVQSGFEQVADWEEGGAKIR